MTAEEIRLRRLAAQNLLFPGEKDGVTRNVCGFQAQFFPNVRQALGLRTGVLPNGDLGEDFVKSWTLRGTIHVFSRQDLPLFLAPEHMRKVFNLGGIVFPTILLRGMVVGKWNRRGEVELFEDLPARDRTHIAEAIQKIQRRPSAPSLHKSEVIYV